MENPTRLGLFNIEAFIRSEGITADVIYLDSLIISNENNVELLAANIKLLVDSINSRKKGE